MSYKSNVGFLNVTDYTIQLNLLNQTLQQTRPSAAWLRLYCIHWPEPIPMARGIRLGPASIISKSRDIILQETKSSPFK